VLSNESDNKIFALSGLREHEITINSLNTPKNERKKKGKKRKEGRETRRTRKKNDHKKKKQNKKKTHDLNPKIPQRYPTGHLRRDKFTAPLVLSLPLLPGITR
jgi:hypothetical protein